MRAENLKFRTDLRDLGMDSWSAIKWMITLIGSKKSLNQNQSSSTATSSQCRSLHGFQTLLHLRLTLPDFATLVAIDSESCPTMGLHRLQALGAAI